MKMLKIYLIAVMFLLANLTHAAISSQTIFEIIENLKEVPEELYLIYNLDVFNYYNIDDCDTELKREVFKKTPQHENYLQELKKMRTEMLKATYYIRVEGKFEKVDYDIKYKGFNITLGQNWGMLTETRPPKSIPVSESSSQLSYAAALSSIDVVHILFKSLPSKQITNIYFGKGYNDEKLFLPINETSGLEIEENREKIDVYFLFTPSGKETITYKYMNIATYNWYNIKKILLKSDKVRIIVTNKETGKIYFDKN
ncbi:MAG: hypothetical protein AABY84_08405 [Candidatus Firestonebacteria bacterium]